MRWTMVISAIAAVGMSTGCGDDNECATGLSGDGALTLAVGDTCIRGPTARLRRAGAWTDGATITWNEDDAGGYHLQLEGDGDVEGFELVLPQVQVDRMLHQGYQSWSFTGNVLIPRQVPMDTDGAPMMQAARTGDPIDEVAGVSFHATLFRNGSDGEVLVVAALSAQIANTGMAAVYDGESTSDITVIYGPQRETLPTATSESLYIAAAASPEQAMDMLRTQLVAEHAGSGFTPQRPPGGWFSWNEHFEDIDEALITAHIAKVHSDLVPVGMNLVEIDDGWQVQWGDWQANTRFPNGMGAVATAITDQDMVAGIWLAPFLVDLESQAATRDPTLFVSGPDGNPLIHMRSGSTRQYYILDGTNPASMAIVTDEIANLAATGFTFFKLDFLYAGAISGGRSRPVTGIEALREGMQRIRDAAPGALINACGSPTLPIIGVADSLRIGPDTAFDGFDLNWSLVAAATRNLATRAHLFPLIWLDADQAQLRAPYTADEAKAGAFAAALAGPAYSLGDDLITLDPSRLATALDSIALDLAASDHPPRPIGLMDAVGDEVPASPVIEAFRYFEGYAVPPPTRFEATGGSGTEYVITFDWAAAHTVTIETR